MTSAKLNKITGFVKGKNTRSNAIQTLSRGGYCVFESENVEGATPMQPLTNLVFGQDVNDKSKAEFIKLIEKNEPELVSLAENISSHTLVEPIRLFKAADGLLLVSGCRRFLSTVYNWVKLGCVPDKCEIECFFATADEEEEHHNSFAANYFRKDMLPMDEARYFNELYTVTFAGEKNRDKKIAEYLGLKGDAGRQRVYMYRRLVNLTQTEQVAVDEKRLGIVKAQERLTSKPAEAHEKTDGSRNHCLPFKKALIVFKEKDKLLEKIKGKKFKDYEEAVKYGMSIVMGIDNTMDIEEQEQEVPSELPVV